MAKRKITSTVAQTAVQVSLTTIQMALSSSIDYVNKFGTNPSIGSTTESIWSYGGLYNWIPSATVLKVSSASANDTSDGTGARTVELQGLADGGALQTETITMGGQTVVTTTKAFYRLFRVKVLTVGSGEKNDGAIYVHNSDVTDGVPDDSTLVYGHIVAGKNQSQQLIYTIPTGYTGFILGGEITTTANLKANVEIYDRPNGGVFNNQYEVDIDQVIHPGPIGQGYAALTDIDTRANIPTGSGRISGRLDIALLVNDDDS